MDIEAEVRLAAYKSHWLEAELKPEARMFGDWASALLLACIFVFEMEFHSCYPGWSAMVLSRFIATSASQVQVIFLPQPPE